MAFTIPDGVFDIYYEVCNELLANTHTSKRCTIVYPEKKLECPNCVYNPFGGSTNTYKAGGPIAFDGGICPYCTGQGYTVLESTEDIRLRVFFNKKEWSKFAGSVQIPEADAMTIGYTSDLPKILAGNKVVLAADESGYADWSFYLAGQPMLHGFGRNMYFITFWKKNV